MVSFFLLIVAAKEKHQQNGFAVEVACPEDKMQCVYRNALRVNQPLGWKWWARLGSHQRHPALQAGALLTELLTHENGAGGRTRTDNPLITSEELYQLSYTGKKHITEGFEPTTAAYQAKYLAVNI